MDIHLLIHNVGYIISIILCLGMGILVFVKDTNRTTRTTLSLAFLSIIIFEVSHLIGVNTPDSHFSKMVLMFNLSIIFVSLFVAHCVLAVINKDKEKKIALIIMYVLSVALFIFYLVFPNTFLIDSIPKLYFPNYYQPGSLHWIMRLLSNFLIPLYFLIAMIITYRQSDFVMRNRLKYFFLALFFAYTVGATPLPLIYNIPFDPIWSIFFVPLFAIPFTYAALQYELMDIRVAAKQAAIYSTAVVCVGFLIGLFIFFNNIVIQAIPNFPIWVVPFICALVSVAVGMFVWKMIRKTDVLKYEFITIITHKFRTPLTRIKWSVENLLSASASAGSDAEEKASLKEIEGATTSLVSLTDILVRLADSDDSTMGEYQMKRINFSAFVSGVLQGYYERFAEKSISVKFDPPLGNLIVFVDEEKMKFVLQTLFDNALSYTPAHGVLSIKIAQQGRSLVCQVRDTGIGIPKEQLQYIFLKFFRTAEAKSADTEGMGIGLSMVKTILNRQRGKIWVESDGKGKGTTFTFTLPLFYSN